MLLESWRTESVRDDKGYYVRRPGTGECLCIREIGREREMGKGVKGDFHEISVVSVELCSYFPSAHPMMSTVM